MIAYGMFFYQSPLTQIDKSSQMKQLRPTKRHSDDVEPDQNSWGFLRCVALAGYLTNLFEQVQACFETGSPEVKFRGLD